MGMGSPKKPAIGVAAITLPAIVLSTALLLSSCGGSGEPEPKRAVDARTEAIHFFPADQPFVAFLNPSTEDRLELRRTVRGLGAVRALRAFSADAAGYVTRAGLELRPLLVLLTDEIPDDGIAASQAAIGLRPRGRPAEDVLIVLASDVPEEMEEAVEKLAAGAGLAELDEFHDARIFSTEEAALAVRDGVVVVAAGAAQLRDALRLRDSDQDDQLDEGQVADVLDELDQGGPLLAYANLERLEGDPAVAALELGPQAWINSLRRAALGVTVGAALVEIEIFAEVEHEAVEKGETRGIEIPLGEEPAEAAFAAQAARQLVSGKFAETSAFHDALIALAPFTVRASVSGEELRATVNASR
jgi:hypothetical protein